MADGDDAVGVAGCDSQVSGGGSVGHVELDAPEIVLAGAVQVHGGRGWSRGAGGNSSPLYAGGAGDASASLILLGGLALRPIDAAYRLVAPAARAFVSFGDPSRGMACTVWLSLEGADGTALPEECTRPR